MGFTQQHLYFGGVNQSNTLTDNYWIKFYGKTGEDRSEVQGVSFDDNKNMYIVGRRRQLAYHGYYTGGNGTYEAVIYKYDQNGNLQWQKRLGETGGVNNGYDSTYFVEVATDGSGNSYAVGRVFEGNVNNNPLGGNVPNGPTWGVLAKFNSSGALQWQRTIKGNASASTNSQAEYYNYTKLDGVTIDNNGDILVCGTLYYSRYDGFIAKFNSSGTIQWQKQFGSSTSWTVLNNIKTDSSGNIFIAGNSNFGAGAAVQGGYHGLLARFNSSGALQWLRKFTSGKGGSFVNNTIHSMTANDNMIVICGGTSTATFKFNHSGTLQWQRQYGDKTAANDGQMRGGRSVAIDNDDNVYTTDFISGATYGLVAANSGTDQMLMKYDTDGNLVYRRFIGSTTSEAEFNSQSDNLHINKQNSIVLNMAASGVYGNVANMTIKIPNDGSLTSSSTYGGYVFTDTPYYTITNDTSSHTVANDTSLSVSSGNATITTSVYSTGNTTQSTSKITIS